MSRDLIDAIKAHVSALVDQRGQPRFASVTSIDSVNHLAKVRYHPDDDDSAWLPVAAVTTGPASIIALPNVGQQVIVIPQDGDAEHGVVMACGFSLQNLPPVSPVTGKAPVPGEVWIAAGAANLHMTGGKTYLTGDLVVTGKITATGNITAGQGGSDQVDMQMHTHGYLPGNNSLAQTNPPMAGT